MSHHPFGAREALRVLTGLDFGLRVHLDLRPSQRTIFAGASGLPVEALTSELAETVASLRVYSYAVRGLLEQVTSALMINLRCGEWLYAERAALDLASLLRQAHRRRLVAGSLALRAANGALRVAELCAREAR